MSQQSAASGRSSLEIEVILISSLCELPVTSCPDPSSWGAIHLQQTGTRYGLSHLNKAAHKESKKPGPLQILAGDPEEEPTLPHLMHIQGQSHPKPGPGSPAAVGLPTNSGTSGPTLSWPSSQTAPSSRNRCPSDARARDAGA